MYDLEYLPVARQDMIDIALYISRELKNPSAAVNLSEELVAAGESIPVFPYANPPYFPLRPLKHEYRKLLVRNHLMLYWIDEDKKVVTIARVVYARSNYDEKLD